MEKAKNELIEKDASKDYGNYLIQVKDKGGRVIQNIISNQCVISIIDLEDQSTSFEIK